MYCSSLWAVALCCVVGVGLCNISRPKIAFLFLTRGPMPLEDLWYEFFRWRADPNLYSVYAHTAAGYQYPNTSIFYEKNKGLSADVGWGKMTQVLAIKRLVREALKDPLNERFCLMSESCIPLVSFPRWYSVIFNHNKSVINSCPMEGMEEYRWHKDLDSTGIKVSDWRKSATWFALNRKHAGVFVDETATERHWEHVMCVDEHYLPTILAWKGLENETTCSDGFTYVHWPSAVASHPSTFTGSDINPSFLKSLERPIDFHYTTSQFSQTCSGYEELCHFAARKFALSAKVPLLVMLKHLFSDEGHPYTNYQWGRYVQRFRRSQGPQGEQLYIIDDNQIRALPDNSTVHAVLHMVRFHESNVTAIPELTASERASYPAGSPYPSRRDGLLYKQRKQREVWYMKGGHRHSVPDWDTLMAMKFTAADIQGIEQADLDLIPVGPPMPHIDYP
jgi:hypothetical protein